MQFPSLQKNNKTRPLLKQVSQVKVKQTATRLSKMMTSRLLLPTLLRVRNNQTLSKVIAHLLLLILPTMLKVRRNHQTIPSRRSLTVMNMSQKNTLNPQSRTMSQAIKTSMMVTAMAKRKINLFNRKLRNSQVPMVKTKNLTMMPQKNNQIKMITMGKTMSNLSLTTPFSLSMRRMNNNLTTPLRNLSTGTITSQRRNHMVKNSRLAPTTSSPLSLKSKMMKTLSLTKMKS